MRRFRGLPGAVAGVLFLGALGHGLPWQDGEETSRPNFVFVLVDDLGWRDVSYNGSRFYETPHIDTLAASGTVFTRAYAASPVCSPTRASILTGQHPARLGLTAAIVHAQRQPETERRFLDAESRDALPEGVPTLVERLAAAGYRTGMVGKWHLGFPPHTPLEAGFERAVGGGGEGGPASYFPPYGVSALSDGPEDEYLTDRLTSEAVRFVRQSREEPFFLLLSHFAVHNPYQAVPELEAKYLAKLDPSDPQRNPTYAAMIESLDRSVGRIQRVLEKLGLAENTVVVFFSDNGGLLTRRIQRRRADLEYEVTSNAPLRSGKGHLYEGGVRVPLIVRWPGVTRAGSTVDVPVTSTDFYPTLLEMAGVEDARTPDGVSLVPLLRGETTEPPHDALYFHLPHQTQCSALLAGNHKLITFFGRRTELYDLARDPGEQRDLAAEEPERVAELRARLEAWFAEVGALQPRPNPDFEKDD